MRQSRRRASDERGAVAVELALVLPVLLLLIFGIIEFGFVFNTQMALTQAAREGVRVEALQISGENGATTAEAAFLAANPNDPPVGVVLADCDSADNARVGITIADYDFFLLPGSTSLSGEAVMRCEG